MLFPFAFLAVNNLDVLKRRNSLKSHGTEQYVLLAGPYGFFVRSSYRDFPNSFIMKAHAGLYGPYDKCMLSFALCPHILFAFVVSFACLISDENIDQNIAIIESFQS